MPSGDSKTNRASDSNTDQRHSNDATNGPSQGTLDNTATLDTGTITSPRARHGLYVIEDHLDIELIKQFSIGMGFTLHLATEMASSLYDKGIKCFDEFKTYFDLKIEAEGIVNGVNAACDALFTHIFNNLWLENGFAFLDYPQTNFKAYMCRVYRRKCR